MKKLNTLFILLLILLPTIFAREPLSEERYLQQLMTRDPFSICYRQQGGNALLIIPTFVRETERQADHIYVTNLADRLCRIEQQNFRKDPTPECINTKSQLIIALNPKETACDYAPNPKDCMACAKTVKFKQDVKEYTFIAWIIGTLILFVLSLFYLLVVGIFYLIKRRLLGKKWLFFASLLILVGSFISLLFVAETVLNL